MTGLFAGDVDVIELAYTQFITMGNQRAVVRRFLPLETDEIDVDTEAAVVDA